jgi:hypothetical protein
LCFIKWIGEENPTPDTTDKIVVVLVVVVLVAVTEPLVPCVIVIVLSGRPVVNV